MPKSQHRCLFFIANDLINTDVHSGRDLIHPVASGFRVPDECGPCSLQTGQCSQGGTQFFSPSGCRRGVTAQLMEVLGLQREGGSGEGGSSCGGQVCWGCWDRQAGHSWDSECCLQGDWTEPSAQNVPVGHGTAKGWHRLCTLYCFS